MSENTTPGHFGPAAAYPPPPPVPPTPAPTGPKRTTLIALLVAAGLVLVSAVAGGVWLLGSNTAAGGKNGDKADGALWSLPYSASGRQFATAIFGTWFEGTTVVKAEPDGIEAVDAKTGHRVWATPTPGDGTVTCQASSDATSGIVVLAYGASQACDHFYALDISANGQGRVLWQHTLQNTDDNQDEDTRIARSGDTVVVSGAHEVTTAFRVSNGQQMWTDSPSTYGGKNCHATQYTGGAQLVRIQACYGADLSSEADVAAVDGSTGHSKWTYSLGDTLDNTSTSVLDTSPIVVNIPGANDQVQLQVLTDDGKLRSKLTPGPYKLVSPTLTVEDGSPATNLTTRGSDLILIADPATSTSGSLANQLVVWSMDTGHRLWDKASPAGQGGYDWFLVGSDGPDLYVYLSGSPFVPTRLVRFDPATGRQNTVHTYPAVGRTRPDVGGDPYGLLHQGVFYVSAGYVIEASSINQDKNQVSLVALPTS